MRAPPSTSEPIAGSAHVLHEVVGFIARVPPSDRFLFSEFRTKLCESFCDNTYAQRSMLYLALDFARVNLIIDEATATLRLRH